MRVYPVGTQYATHPGRAQPPQRLNAHGVLRRLRRYPPQPQIGFVYRPAALAK